MKNFLKGKKMMAAGLAAAFIALTGLTACGGGGNGGNSGGGNTGKVTTITVGYFEGAYGDIHWKSWEKLYNAAHPNEKIELDSEETTIDPSAAAMAGARSEDESRDPLDEILKQFNENFKGFEGSPEDQKAILLNITKKVHDDADFRDLVMGNPDTAAALAVQNKIIDRVMRQTRKNQESIYRGYYGNKEMFYNIIGNMLGSFEFLNK